MKVDLSPGKEASRWSSSRELCYSSWQMAYLVLAQNPSELHNADLSWNTASPGVPIHPHQTQELDQPAAPSWEEREGCAECQAPSIQMTLSLFCPVLTQLQSDSICHLQVSGFWWG